MKTTIGAVNIHELLAVVISRNAFLYDLGNTKSANLKYLLGSRGKKGPANSRVMETVKTGFPFCIHSIYHTAAIKRLQQPS